MSDRTPAQEYGYRMAALFKNRGEAKSAPVEAAGPPGAFAMDPLVAYRCGDAAAGWVLCMMRDENDVQQAFNEVTGAAPAGLEAEVREWTPRSRIKFTYIEPCATVIDPLAQHGYFGMKWKPKS